MFAPERAMQQSFLSPIPALPLRLQDAPPSVARACLGIRRFMRDTLDVTAPWPRCLAAVSGGADSTALLVALRLLGVPLVVAHIDHALRPESATEAGHVAGLAEALALPCACVRIDVADRAAAWGVGFEEAGRAVRYAALETMRREHRADWILTGHHLDDLCEDVLLRLIRGSGWPSLAGMPARDDARRLLRPLLHTPKAALCAMLKAVGLAWNEDASNRARNVRRNRIRLDLLPLIRAENPAFGQSVRRLWQLARLDEAYWAHTIPAPTPERPEGPEGPGLILLAKERLDRLAPAARLRLYMACLKALGGKGQALADNLLRLDALWQARRGGTLVQLPGASATITRQGIIFCLTGRGG